MDLIDREKLQSAIREMVEIPNEVRVKVLGAVSRAKAVGAVEVVRCKDCIHVTKWRRHGDMTQADLLRILSDEDLAEFLLGFFVGTMDINGIAHEEVTEADELEILRQLQQPAEDDSHA